MDIFIQEKKIQLEIRYNLNPHVTPHLLQNISNKKRTYNRNNIKTQKRRNYNQRIKK